jgi:hypothetical protein
MGRPWSSQGPFRLVTVSLFSYQFVTSSPLLRCSDLLGNHALIKLVRVNLRSPSIFAPSPSDTVIPGVVWCGATYYGNAVQSLEILFTTEAVLGNYVRELPSVL